MARMPSPFSIGEVHPLARRAADELVAELRGGLCGGLDARGGGKMFGVLVARDRGGEIRVLRGFSGMLDGAWEVPGFVPPAFDLAARDAFWPAGEAELAELDRRIAALDGGEAAARREAHAAVVAGQAAREAAMAARHRERRAARRAARAGAGADAARAALDRESRGDGAERRRLLERHGAERAAIEAALATTDAALAALRAHKAARSRDLLGRIHATYVLSNARGERRALRELFAPHPPPGGAGDCAGPKLLAEAYRRGLTPIALAELWWGAPPEGGGRIAGRLYPACRGKCGAVLGFMLQGLDVAPAPLFGGGPIGAEHPRAVHEDRWLVVVDKPCGLLSVPGRSGRLTDSVATRMARRHPDASGPLVTHRLDLDTSGLLLVALDAEVHVALQRQFARREVDKRYVAWLDGEVAGEAGSIELPLRVDVDDRPRQIVDPVHGRAALTEWRVLARSAGRTRVALMPRTGRTHQLRVHAAVGLGAPIVGDRLYGRDASERDRLLLHAEAIAFTHPSTGERVALELPAPF